MGTRRSITVTVGTLNPGPTFGRLNLDSVGLADAATFSRMLRPVDLAGLTDSAAGRNARLRSIGDPVGITDAFTRFEVGTTVPIGSLDVAGSAVLPTGATRVRNVGVRPGVTLVPYLGDYTLVSGEIVSGLDVYGRFITAGALLVPAYVSDCKARGIGTATSEVGIVFGHNDVMSGTVFEWCTFDATGNESFNLDGPNGGQFTVRYCEVARVVDGIHLTLGSVTVEACRIYNNFYFSWWNTSTGAVRTATFTDHGGTTWNAPFPTQSTGDTHCDGIQMAGSASNVIRGNYIGGPNLVGHASNETHLDPTDATGYASIQSWNQMLCFHNSAMILNASDGNHIGGLVEQNWLHGGAACANFGYANQLVDKGAGLTFQNNIIVRSGSTGFGVYVMTGWAGAITGTTYDDNGAAVTTVFH